MFLFTARLMSLSCSFSFGDRFLHSSSTLLRIFFRCLWRLIYWLWTASRCSRLEKRPGAALALALALAPALALGSAARGCLAVGADSFAADCDCGAAELAAGVVPFVCCAV